MRMDFEERHSAVDDRVSGGFHIFVKVLDFWNIMG